ITGTDPANCGGCGRTCAPSEVCNDGNCVCECGSDCFDVSSDPRNCGGCNIVCPGLTYATAHGAPTCSGGVGGFGCQPNWGDCNKISDDGCETNLRDDPLNCGGCGIRCDAVEGQACIDGQCAMKECGIE